MGSLGAFSALDLKLAVAWWRGVGRSGGKTDVDRGCDGEPYLKTLCHGSRFMYDGSSLNLSHIAFQAQATLRFWAHGRFPQWCMMGRTFTPFLLVVSRSGRKLLRWEEGVVYQGEFNLKPNSGLST